MYLNKQQAKGIATLVNRMKVNTRAYARARALNEDEHGHDWGDEAHKSWDVANSCHMAIDWALGQYKDPELLECIADEERWTLQYYGFTLPTRSK